MRDFVIYAEDNLICILFLLMIWINDRINDSRQDAQVWFARVIVSMCIYFAVDIGWASILFGHIKADRVTIILLNLAIFFFSSLMSYGWFMFSASLQKMSFRNSPTIIKLCFLPVPISLAIIIVCYLFDPYFWINESGELNNIFLPIMYIVPSIYIFSSFAHSIINARIKTTREEKILCFQAGVFPIAVIVFSMIQIFFPKVPTFCFGCTFTILAFYIQNMQSLISVDSLTQLNNRRQINRYIKNQNSSGDDVFYILMIDVDSFKHINDSYGHAEGDRALVLVAEVLKKTCGNLKASTFIGRYGGDEFTVIIKNPGADEHPDLISASIQNTLTQECINRRLDYVLTLSIGYDEMRNDGDTLLECLNRADNKLYKEKQRRFRLRIQFSSSD